jgi:predicted transcriptional regulator
MRSVKLLKVQGHEGLVRDTASGAIVSHNENEFAAYKLKREADLKRHKQIEQQVQEINELKNEMLEIKQMLSILIKGK